MAFLDDIKEVLSQGGAQPARGSWQFASDPGSRLRQDTLLNSVYGPGFYNLTPEQQMALKNVRGGGYGSGGKLNEGADMDTPPMMQLYQTLLNRPDASTIAAAFDTQKGQVKAPAPASIAMPLYSLRPGGSPNQTQTGGNQYGFLRQLASMFNPARKNNFQGGTTDSQGNRMSINYNPGMNPFGMANDDYRGFLDTIEAMKKPALLNY